MAFGATANKVMFLFSEGYQPLLVPRWAQGTRAAAHLLGISARKFLLRDQWQGSLGSGDTACGLSAFFSAYHLPKVNVELTEFRSAFAGVFSQLDSEVLQP